MIVTVLILGGVLLTFAALALQTARAMFDEDTAAAGRLRIENAAVQASALAEEMCIRDRIYTLLSDPLVKVEACRSEGRVVVIVSLRTEVGVPCCLLYTSRCV